MSKLFHMLNQAPLGGMPSAQSVWDLILRLVFALAMTGLIMGVYRLCHDSLSYNRKFNLTMPMLSLASTLLLALIQNNPMFSLGALGALSICRIRTNTHDPRDLGFVFWSISIGICAALGTFLAGIAESALLSFVLLIASRADRRKDSLTMIVRGTKEQMEKVEAIFRRTRGSTIQSKNIFSDSFEFVYELKVSQEEEEKLITIFKHMDGIDGVNVLAPQTKVA